MAAKRDTSVPAAQQAHYEKLIGTLPDIERKGKALPYTSCNGHMFSFLSEDGTLAIRLPAEVRNLS